MIILYEVMHVFRRVEGGDATLLATCNHGEAEARKVMRLLRPGSQVQTYTVVYQYANDAVNIREDSGGYGQLFC